MKFHTIKSGSFLTLIAVLIFVLLLLYYQSVENDLLITIEEKDQNKIVTQWFPYLEWNLINPTFSGNPFDVIAWVTFTHSKSKEVLRTQMFYTGNDVWKFRFTGTKVGTWYFVTKSDQAALDGIMGKVTVFPNPEPETIKPLTSKNNRFAQILDCCGNMKTFLFNVYLNENDFRTTGVYGDSLLEWIDNAEERTVAYCNEAKSYGLDTIFINPHIQWFKIGAQDHSVISKTYENPDLATFAVIDRIIISAAENGCYVHIWAWGDEERKWTPTGIGRINFLPDKRPFRRIQRHLNNLFGKGGINGVPDKRLQRYIAARLGPLPGWSMSYGFDLEEWVTEDQVGEWAKYMHEHMGWPHLLMARGKIHPELNVRSISHYGGKGLPKSYDDVVEDMDFDKSRPHLYEERFLYTRYDYFSMDITRRHMWWYTMAGGMGGFWGVMWDGGPYYPNPEQMLTHKRFWDERFLLELERANNITDGYALATSNNNNFVFYKEDSSSLFMNLSGMKHAQPAIAVDTKKEYHEIDLGHLEAVKQTWSAPYVSDWTIAVGFF